MEMAARESITHEGRVVEVTPAVTSVEIISESACSACHAKSLCSLGESKSKIIEVPTRLRDGLVPGDKVVVELRASMGHKAVWLGYGVPLMLLLVGILLPSALGMGEVGCGLCALGLIAVYYLVLWLLRKPLRNEYIFNIKK